MFCGVWFTVWCFIRRVASDIRRFTVILEHSLTLFEHLGYLLEQRALLLDNATFIRTFFAILEQPGNILENAPRNLIPYIKLEYDEISYLKQ